MAVGNPLEFAKEREVTRGPHVFDHGTYVPTPNFVPTIYPKWMFKDKKQKLANDEAEELVMIDAGWSNEPAKEVVLQD